MNVYINILLNKYSTALHREKLFDNTVISSINT